jgi:hypothetical protein
MASETAGGLEQAEIPLDRDRFLRALIRQLAGTLEDVIGLEEAKGYFSLVGSTIGRDIGQSYLAGLQRERLDRAEVAAVLVDLKRRTAEEADGREYFPAVEVKPEGAG